MDRLLPAHPAALPMRGAAVVAPHAALVRHTDAFGNARPAGAAASPQVWRVGGRAPPPRRACHSCDSEELTMARTS